MSCRHSHLVRSARLRFEAVAAWSVGNEAQIRDWARHESVINVAFADLPMRFLCPYDARVLTPEILEHANVQHAQLLSRIRADRQFAAIPVIMLTAKSMDEDKVAGLNTGADDYVTKPFSIRELIARTKAVLRRSSKSNGHGDAVGFSDVSIDMKSCRVTRRGKPVEVSAKEFELLKYFIFHSGETLSRERLLTEVWGYEHFPTTRTVDAHIVRLRQKLEPSPEQPHFFLTVHGIGYKFVG